MDFRPGQRVRRRGTTLVGVIADQKDLRGQIWYEVSFGERTEWLRPSDLEPLSVPDFKLLEHPPSPLYPYDGWLRREALRLADAYRNDPTAALSNSRVEPQHHQVSALLRALEQPQPRLILSDEVGLGKTIEAGLILKELRSRGVLKRTLILAPASLLSQWQRELQTKFNEWFVIHDGALVGYFERTLQRTQEGANPWAHEANVLVSYQFARNDTRIADAEWDLVIFDEAHHARRHWNNGSPYATKAYELMEALRDRVGSLLLLTATPMQTHEFELYSLIELVAPGLFANFSDFQLHRTLVARINLQVEELRSLGPYDRSAQLQDLLRELSAPNDIAALAPTTPQARDTIAAWLEQQHRIAQVLVRNRRAVVGGFAQRKARRIPVEPTIAERELERDLIEYVRRRYSSSRDEAERTAIGLVLTTFLKLSASSSRALASALERRAARIVAAPDESEDQLVDDASAAEEFRLFADNETSIAEHEAAELRELASRARRISDTKLAELEGTLKELLAEDPDEKVLVFSQFLGTIEMIRERLEAAFPGRVEVFHGLLTREEKDRAHGLFRSRANVLISSEAGGEGRNFQFAHILVNYDLPWNPMRIEQRIGRLDRFGQKRNVLTYNFEGKGSLDARILELLEQRIKVFTESVGALEPILGNIEGELREAVLRDAAAGRAVVERYDIDLEERKRRAREQNIQLGDLIMDRRSLRQDEVSRLLDREALATPEELQRLLQLALKRYPAGRLDAVDGGEVRILVPEALREQVRRSDGPELRSEYAGSFDWRVASADEDRLEFFAFGHPLIDAIIEFLTSDEFASFAIIESGAVDWIDNFLVDYELSFQAVRPRRELFSHTVGPAGVRPPLDVDVPRDPMSEATSAPVSAQRRADLEQLSWEAAQLELERRLEVVEHENASDIAGEERRLQLLHAFRERFIRDRIGQREKWIGHVAEWGTPEQKRILPAVQAQLDADRSHLAGLLESQSGALAELRSRGNVSPSLRLLGITCLAPTGSLTEAFDEGAN